MRVSYTRSAVAVTALLTLVACGPDEVVSPPAGTPLGQRSAARQEVPLLSVLPEAALDASQRAHLERARQRRYARSASLARTRGDAVSALRSGQPVVIELDESRRIVLDERIDLRRIAGANGWSGRSRDGSASLDVVLGAGGISGLLHVGAELYRIAPLDDGLYAVWAVGIMPRDGEPLNPADEPMEPYQPSASFNAQASSSGARIDVLFAYTTNAAAGMAFWAGSTSQFIADAVYQTNVTYANSLISQHIQSVGSTNVSYSEAYRSYGQHVGSLQSTTDGIMDAVHTLRNQTFADVVVLFVDDQDENTCGVASGYGSTAGTAFVVVNYTCAIDAYSLAHEIGHLQGARHDIHNDGVTYYNNGDAHGFVDPNKQWRTVMAYANTCGYPPTCPRIPYFSNPNLTHPSTGQPLGHSTFANNARVLNASRYNLANYRKSLTTTATTPNTAGHYASCTWTANPSGGYPPYSYSWNASWTSGSTGYQWTSGQFSQTATGFGFYYGYYPSTATITVRLWVTDAAGQTVDLQRNMTQLGYSAGCYY